MSFLKDLLGIFSNNSRTFQITYRTTLVSTVNKELKTSLIMPLPSDSVFQKIGPNVEVYPQGYSQSKEKKFGNKYLWWDVVLRAKESKTYSISFSAQVSYPNISVNPNFCTSDYQDVNPLYLDTNEYINPTNPKIKNLVATLIQGETNLLKVIRKLNDYVVNSLSYGNPIPGLYKLEEVLDREKVDCGGFDVLLCSLLRSAGIPATLASGFWSGYDLNQMHAWVLIQLPDTSHVVADPSMEYLHKHSRTKKLSGLFKTDNDRIALSVGENLILDINGQKQKLGILQNPILFPNIKTVQITTEFVSS